MINYLRLIIIFALVAIVGIAGYSLWTLPSLTMPSIVKLVEKNNSGFAQGYANTVWRKYRETMLPLLAGDPKLMKDNPAVPQFAQETAQYFGSLPLVRANMYTANGVLLLTIHGSAEGRMASNAVSPDPAFVSGHMKWGGVVSKLSPEAHADSHEAPLVQTMMPIRVTGSQTTEGMLEIVSPLPDLPEVLAFYQKYAIGGIGVVAIFFLLVLFLILFSMTRKSEAIITKQHEANLELMEAVAAAQAENRDKSQFLANVSHELRTPLNAIIGFSEILKTEVIPVLPDKKYENYITDINMSGTHLLSLINDILDYSKAEAGKLELEVSEINATKLVQNSLRLVSPRAEAGQIKLSETLPKDHLTMTTDSKKFKQVLLNLLSNAVKFTPSGGEVKVGAWQNVADDTITFEVRDTGIGIAPKDISKAMAPFSQIDNTLKRKYEGTGLGLPLTKKFVELLGGKFTIESELNKGTTITFTLPRVIKSREGVVVKQAS